MLTQTPAPAASETQTTLLTASETAQPAEKPGLPQQTAAPQDQPINQTPAPTDPYAQLALPEDVEFDPAQLASFKKLAGELQLSDEQVQKIIDFEAATAKAQTEQAGADKRRIIAQWAEQTKAQYGTALDGEIALALRAANHFGGPQLRALLEETGLGNHPVIIRTLGGVGRMLSEDESAGGVAAAVQDKTFAEALYGKHN